MLSIQEIKTRALQLALEYEHEKRERAEAQSFWNDFFQVFGVKRKRVVLFEAAIPKTTEGTGKRFADFLWPGTCLGEAKSAGGDLDEAFQQAHAYALGLPEEKQPRYILLSDFKRLRLYDLEPDQPLPDKGYWAFPLSELQDHLHLFDFISGHIHRKVEPDDPLNIKAAELLAGIHDRLEAGGYRGHQLEVYLVRLLFCLYGEDTGLFDDKMTFTALLNQTREDGFDLGAILQKTFEVLNTSSATRPSNLPEDFAGLPYVNGGLFEEKLDIANFDGEGRRALLRCTKFDWSAISPAIFGSLFQAVMEPKARRQLGAHYTSERDILKVLRPLFLDRLWKEFEHLTGCTPAQKPKHRKLTQVQRRALEKLHDQIASLKLFDPACGCGNFLIVAYRELRRVETAILMTLQATTKEKLLDISVLARVSVKQFYGIEILEFPARIAQTGLWLMDHACNRELSSALGQYFVRLPLAASAHIVVDNALRLDWKTVLSPEDQALVFGNPPFGGAKCQNAAQKDDLHRVWGATSNAGLLDYVTGWYGQAAEYIQGTKIRCAFVSTNSITQGEQVSVLWPALFSRGVRIHFAYRTFPWESEARGKAHVHVVIIGFSIGEPDEAKRIYEYHNGKDHNGDEREHESALFVENISPYLIEGPDIVVGNRQKPLCAVPEIGIGNKPIDGGHYLFTPQAKRDFLKKEPSAAPYFRRWLGSEEFLNGIERWCLWLGDCPPEKLLSMPHCLDRVEKVRKFRQASKSPPTRVIAGTPTRFHVENMPAGKFLVIPKTSSERREYIPIGFVSEKTLVGDACFILPEAGLFHLGVLSSAMHMAWVRTIAGRLKSDYRYSAKLVYNNFPWPDKVSPSAKKAVETAAQAVLAARSKFTQNTLAQLYDPRVMPPALRKAHTQLDRAVERCYRRQSFQTEAERLAFLLREYQRLSGND